MNLRAANVAKAKLVYNQKKETYKIIIAFNVTERNKRGILKFPPSIKCDFVSGDIIYETLQNDVARIIDNAKEVLRTDKIEFI